MNVCWDKLNFFGEKETYDFNLKLAFKLADEPTRAVTTDL